MPAVANLIVSSVAASASRDDRHIANRVFSPSGVAFAFTAPQKQASWCWTASSDKYLLNFGRIERALCQVHTRTAPSGNASRHAEISAHTSQVTQVHHGVTYTPNHTSLALIHEEAHIRAIHFGLLRQVLLQLCTNLFECFSDEPSCVEPHKEAATDEYPPIAVLSDYNVQLPPATAKVPSNEMGTVKSHNLRMG